MRIAMIIAFNGFRDEELLVPHEKFLREGHDVVVYSSQTGTAIGKYGATFKVDHTLDELDVSEYDAVVFIGGPGGYGFIGNPKIQKIVKETDKQGKWLTAICMAPQLIAETGLLRGKRATIFNGDKERLIHFGAKYTGKPVEVDGKIITADGPASASVFADTILQKLNGG